MEVKFAHAYLILFGKLSAGGLLALAVPSFAQVERGFFRSTAAVYLGLAYIMAAGEGYLFARYGHTSGASWTSVLAWSSFAVLFSGYTATLFVELPLLRARLFPAATLAGLASLAATGWSYVPNETGFLAAVPFAASLVVGAAISGAAVTGMLLGHWYLIDTGLDLAPLRRMLAYCSACLRLEVVVVVVVALVLWLWPGSPWQEAFVDAFGGRFYLLALGRVIAWALALFLLALIARTLAIPQTMAATGLFYIQALVVAVGEICGHWLLFRTGLPL